MNENKQLLSIKLGEFIRQKRIDKSLTGYQLGQLLNVSQQQISRYENGKNDISIELLNTIILVLNVTWDDFLREVIGENSKDYYEEFYFN